MFLIAEGETVALHQPSGQDIPSKVRALSDLVKPELPLAAGVCVVAGEILGTGTLPSAPVGLMGFLTGFFLSGAAMITNDYFDLEVDRVNNPWRPLPSGRVSARELWALAALFSASGLLSAALLGIPVLALAIALLAVGILYNWRFKETGLPGNMMVAFSVGMTFVCGGAATGTLTNGLVWTFGAMAFIFDLAEEIASGAMDMEGDRIRSAKSVALVYGKKCALQASGLLLASFVAVSFLPFVMGWLDHIFLVIFMPMGLATLYSAMKLQATRTREEGRARLRWLYLAMTFFIVAIVAVSVLFV